MLEIIKNKLAFLIGLFFPMFLLNFKGEPVSIYFIVMYILLSVIHAKKIILKKYNIFPLMLALSMITLAISMQNNWSEAWKNVAKHAFLEFGIFALFSILEEGTICLDDIYSLKQGLKLACFLEIIWCYLQFIFYYAMGININEVVFRDILHLIDIGDAIIYLGLGRLSICGFGWHPAQLVGVIILAYCMFDSFLLKILTFGVAVISLNSTCIIAIITCIMLDFVTKKRNNFSFNISTKAFTQKFLSIFLGIFVIICITQFQFVSELITGRISDTFERIISIMHGRSSSVSTQSTFLHLRYYTGYPKIAAYIGMVRALFGMGYECSGYPYSQVFGQYAEQSSWGVESDPINLIVGRGWIWTILFYITFGIIAVKGGRINHKYVVFIGALFVAGIFYNNQFPWIIFLEVILYICVRRNYDFWSDR